MTSDTKGISRRQLLAGAAASLTLVRAKAAQVASVESQHRDHADLTMSAGLDYLASAPKAYDSTRADRHWPLLIFLHGSGERGPDLELVKKHGPPKLIAAGHSFPFIVVSPQCPHDEWWDSLVLEAFIDVMQNRYRVDATRIYLTGLSMGGYAVWDLAVRHPERYAAIAPVCGAGNPLRAEALVHMPTWAFHGAKDPVVPRAYADDMIKAIRGAGGAPRLTVYPEAGHDSWTETYANEALYAWFLEQSRPLSNGAKA